jgi:hypothetical protein
LSKLCGTSWVLPGVHAHYICRHCQHPQLKRSSSPAAYISDCNQLLLLLLYAAGSMSVNDDQLGARDAAKVKGGDDGATLLKLSTAEGAHFMVIEMAKSNDE